MTASPLPSVATPPPVEPAKSKAFDPYHKWLGIRDSQSPPNYYRLLGVDMGETDAEVIRDAASRQINHVRQFRSGPFRVVCQQILDELRDARDTLQDPEQRKAYDRRLKQTASDSAPEPAVHSSNGAKRLTSTGAVPHSAAEVVCGHCNAKNPGARQFCSGCGTLLWEPCIACAIPCGPGELHCGSCGVNLATAVQQRVAEIQQRLDEAEQMRQRYEHHRAVEILEECVVANHPKLTAHRQQLKRLIEQLRREADQHEQLATTALAEAQRFCDEGDDQRAIEIIEQLPPQMLTEPMRQLLAPARARHAEALAVAAEIRQALNEKRIEGLLAKVERLLALRPHDADALKLQNRLQPLETKRAEARRDQLCKLALSEAHKHNYANAVGLVEQIPEDQRTPQIVKLLDGLKQRAAESEWLRFDLRHAAAYDEHLLPLAERLLKLQPDDGLGKKVAGILRERAQATGGNAVQANARWPAPPAQSHWGYAIDTVSNFHRIDTRPLTSADFRHDPGRYCVGAGLALQALQKTVLGTNLAPREKGGMLSRLKQKKVHSTAWGLDLGRNTIKAIQLAYLEGEDRVVAVKSESIEHGRQTAATGAAGHNSIQTALDAFLDRNDLGNCGIAISLPGQKVLSRFFGLPLIDKETIASIMHYEVKQQIPLPLEVLAWDYQMLDATSEQADSDAAAEHPIALFAIQSDDVKAQLQPLVDRKFKVDVVQSDCAALYNFLAYDRLAFELGRQKLPAGRQGVVALLDIGADASSVVVTCGHTMWMRSIPLGGNDFTRALTKEFNLDWVAAEKLQRQPTAAPLVHRVYEALQPTLQKLADEVQHSIDQFVTQDNRRLMQRLLVSGGGLKLHGLLRFLCLGR